MRLDAARVMPHPGQADPVQSAKGQNVGPSSDEVKTASRPIARKGAVRNRRSRQVSVTTASLRVASCEGVNRGRLFGKPNRCGVSCGKLRRLAFEALLPDLSYSELVEGAVEEGGRPEEPGVLTRIVEAAVVGNLAEDAWRILTEQHPGKLMTKLH